TSAPSVAERTASSHLGQDECHRHRRKVPSDLRVRTVESDVLPEELHRRPTEELADALRAAVALDRLRHLVADEVEARLVPRRVHEAARARLLPAERALAQPPHDGIEDGKVLGDPLRLRVATKAIAR